MGVHILLNVIVLVMCQDIKRNFYIPVGLLMVLLIRNTSLLVLRQEIRGLLTVKKYNKKYRLVLAILKLIFIMYMVCAIHYLLPSNPIQTSNINIIKMCNRIINNNYK